METILTSLKAGVPRDSLAELTSYFGTERPSDQTRSDNFGDKLLTNLSSNPSQLEKELRNIVLDLYSDYGPVDEERRNIIMDSNRENEGPADKEHGGVKGLEPFRGTFLRSSLEPLHKDVFSSEILNSAGQSSSLSSLKDTKKASPILLKYQETALVGNLTNKTQQQASPLLQNGMTSSTGGDDRTDKTLLKSFEELQPNLDKFEMEEASELLRDRHGSIESRSLGDSGIHVEFLISSDNETNDSMHKGNSDGSHDRNDVDGKESKIHSYEDYAFDGNEDGIRLEGESEDQRFHEPNLPLLLSTDAHVLSSTPNKASSLFPKTCHKPLKRGCM